MFIIAYVLTIPWRNYEKLVGGFVDISQGVPIWVHLVIIVIALIFLLILLKILEMIVKLFLKRGKV